MITVKSPETLLAERAKLLGCVNIVKDEQTNEFKFKGTVDLALTNVNLKIGTMNLKVEIILMMKK